MVISSVRCPVVDHQRQGQAISRCDASVIQRYQRWSFSSKMRRAVTIRQENFGEDLYGDVAVQPGIAGAINLTYPASVNTGQDFAGAQTFAREDRHGLPFNLEWTEYNRRSSVGLYSLFMGSPAGLKLQSADVC